ncbi:WD repeat-containing protein 33 [Coelomomyces lativittatus]|nr:WD repeat-containing protein 33 [Coelomomyces lativittatus]
MRWSRNGIWLVSGDHQGFVKYWHSNMNPLKSMQAHLDSPIRGLGFSPMDTKLATCADDQKVKIWYLHEAVCEQTLLGHGWEVKCLDWHPCLGLVASGGKDHVIKLWDPRSGLCISTIHGHKNTIHSITWNQNGHWLLSGSRDQTIKLFDIRSMKEVMNFKGHPNEVCSVRWHPQHECLFASGGSDGTLFFWHALHSTALHSVKAHDANIWAMDWHPLGHLLCTGSNDYATRFWSRARPGQGDEMQKFGTHLHDPQLAGDIAGWSQVVGVGTKSQYGSSTSKYKEHEHEHVNDHNQAPLTSMAGTPTPSHLKWNRKSDLSQRSSRTFDKSKYGLGQDHDKSGGSKDLQRMENEHDHEDEEGGFYLPGFGTLGLIRE